MNTASFAIAVGRGRANLDEEVDWRTGELAEDLRLLWIIDRVRAGCISLGRGAMLAAGMDRWVFIRAMDEQDTSVIGYSVEDLKKDVATLGSLIVVSDAGPLALLQLC